MRFSRDPYAFFADCERRYGDLFTVRFPGNPPLVTASDPALVKQIFSLRADEYEQGALNLPFNIGDASLLLLDGDRHRRERQLMHPHLHGERLRSYAALIQNETDKVIDRWQPGVPLSIHPAIQQLTFDIVLRCVFGFSDTAQMDRLRKPLLAWMDGVMTPALSLVGMLVRGVRLRRFLDAEVRKSVARYPRHGLSFLPWQRWADSKAEVLVALREDVERCRREGVGDRADVLAMLCSARYEDGTPMEVDHILDELITLLVGGHDTTAVTVSWFLNHVLPRADVMAKLRAEMDRVFGGGTAEPTRVGELTYLDACLKESLRLTPIVPAIMRHLRTSIQMRDYEIPAGTVLSACPYLTHHRTDLWPEPERFRPERFLDAGAPPASHFFPFGGGRRTCIGIAFANHELRIILARILSRAELRLAPGAPARAALRGITIAPSSLSIIADRILPA